MAKSNTQRQADYRARKKAAKLLRKEYWVTAKQDKQIMALLEKSLCKTMKLKAHKGE